ncbi:U-box domain-containing protein 35 [Quillaja saponaria]|uniref:U-box domain-containing protein 35 n=1 Tax=Quillaja saponaria TaxID=32244 RepID=A0AAD7M0T1_QUISA|nr:U-box domain-containing protein 35 [Quillaja saponaria]
MSLATLTETSQSLQLFTSTNGYGSGVSEIEEEISSNQVSETNVNRVMETISEEYEDNLMSFDVDHRGEDCVYVAVGKSESSMEALSWTLKHVVTSSTMVYLIHIFPEIKHIPSPLITIFFFLGCPSLAFGWRATWPKKEAREEISFRNSLTHALLLRLRWIPSLLRVTLVAKALLDLIPILQMRKLVVGTAKSNLRRLKSRKGNGIADQLLQNAPESCEVKIVSEGKEVNEHMIGSPSPSTSCDDTSSKYPKTEDQQNDSFSCMCFKPKFMKPT